MNTASINPDMAEIIQQGAAMLDDVGVAVYLCRTEPDPSSVLAKTCGSLVSRYLVLSRRLRSLPPSALSQRVAELLSCHLELTGQASMLAFRPHDSHWDALAKGFGEGLGELSTVNEVSRPTKRSRPLRGALHGMTICTADKAMRLA